MIEEKQINETLHGEIKTRVTVREKTIIMSSIIIIIVTAYVFYYAFLHDEYFLTILAFLIVILSSLEIFLVLWRKRIKKQRYRKH